MLLTLDDYRQPSMGALFVASDRSLDVTEGSRYTYISLHAYTLSKPWGTVVYLCIDALCEISYSIA